ncbi:MAG TPA: hypothetical protein VGL86_06765 [Polyangia bacterium]|jgi:hypothetical protein
MMRAAAIVAFASLAGCGAKPPVTNAATTPPATPVLIAPLHLGGDPPPAPTSVGPPGTVVQARYRVCLDDAGRVRAVTPAPGLSAVDAAAMAALRGWSWFVVTRQASVCFVAPMELAVPRASRLLHQATSAVRAHAASPIAPRPPTWLTRADASYKVCVGDDGLVQTVRAIAGVPGGDDALMAALRATGWDLVVPTLARAPYCFAAPLRLDLSRAAHGDEARPATPFPPDAGRATQAGVSVVVHVRAAALPPSPPRARVCVNADGSVATVEPPAAALGAARYVLDGPAGVGFCDDVTR